MQGCRCHACCLFGTAEHCKCVCAGDLFSEQLKKRNTYMLYILQTPEDEVGAHTTGADCGAIQQQPYLLHHVGWAVPQQPGPAAQNNWGRHC